MAGKIKITQKKRPSTEKQKITLLGLGLKKIDSSRVCEDTPSIKGMLDKVRHLVTIEEA